MSTEGRGLVNDAHDVWCGAAGFQYLTETFVALQRIDKFLGMPEPPPAVHMRARKTQQQQASQSPAKASGSTAAAVAGINGARGTPITAQQEQEQPQQASIQQQPSVVAEGSSSIGGRSSPDGIVVCDLPDGYVELGGADYDWTTNVQEMASQV